MASHKSAAKKSKQDISRRDRNRSGRSRLRTELKKIRALIAEGSSEAKDKLPAIYSLIDVSAKKGFIHDNAAARLKSRLTQAAN
ncbi:30S ribosomal protein S20 [Acanthopleuribacter pedis]|uniref:Small ribosomal subunit protein bS20 n=1 Tax=Acanthopleuribacter pedis TaxID=442870 RepID=A0A8J7Q1Q6_9BACT|nr:30S ribosomal protein S20 [Acanthopleuribacter pedis]MBO1318832.1 30S ribosomal protein S20 [Acanthopleuribacter pedis]